MHVRNFVPLVLAFCFCACGSSSNAPLQKSKPIDLSPGPSAVIPPEPVESARAAEKPTTSSCPNYAEAMRKGEDLAAKGQHAEAVKAFGEAVLAKPYDARARLLRGKSLTADGLAEPDELVAARSLSIDPKLKAEAWFEEGRAFEQKGEMKDARLAYAVAAVLGWTAAEAKLGTQSRCTATFTTEGIKPLNIVKGWKAIVAQRDQFWCDEPPPPATEAAAKKEVCTPCEGGRERSKEDACSGESPYIIPQGVTDCTWSYLLVQPMGNNSFYVDGDRHRLEKVGADFRRDLGNEPSFAYNEETVKGITLQFNGVRWSENTQDWDPPECPVDTTAEVDIPRAYGCSVGHGRPYEVLHEQIFYDRRGKGLLEVKSYGPRVNVTLKGNNALIEGAGCKETVPLSR